MNRPRIILMAGKGGVGKSTVAAATALACAARGVPTLVASIDSAHNLGDLFQLPIGGEPNLLSPGLWGLEINTSREINRRWGDVVAFFRSLLGTRDAIPGLVAEECAVLPGMEEVFALLRLHELCEAGEFGAVIIDAPPTGDLLKYLRLPDVLQWFLARYHPFDRGMLNRMRPVAEVFNWPVPSDGALREMDDWFRQVREMGAMLADSTRVSVRLVMNPDGASLRETRRALIWTCLLGMSVDGIIANKQLPAQPDGSWLAAWSCRQARLLAEASQEFDPLPLLRIPLQPGEVLGAPALAALGESLYEDRDPAAVWSSGSVITWSEHSDGGELCLRLPGLQRGEFRLHAVPDGLVLEAAGQRRQLPLPLSVRRLAVAGARYEENRLIVRFTSTG